MVYLLSLFSLLFAVSANAAVVPSGVPSVGFGAAINTSAAQGSMIAAGDLTKYYAVQCGPGGGGNSTSGNYYKCFKQGGSASDWSVASTKTAYCPGFYVASNANAAVSVIFGYGTAAVTNNSGTDPAGVVSYATNGFSVGYAASSSHVLTWFSYPVFFPGSGSTGGPGATIYPWIKAGNSGATLGVVFICQDL